MPAGHDFIFFIQDKQNRFWGLNASGEVVITSNPYPLVFSPDGWDDLIIKNIRNKKYWAIDRSVSFSFKYVEDGAKILKHIFYNRGPEESVYLAICEQQLHYEAGVQYGWWYKMRFKSEIDLSTFKHNGPVVTCTTLEDGLAKHLKANENTVYEFPLGNEKVKLDGITLTEKANFKVIDGLDITKSESGSRFIIPMAFTGKDGNTSPIAFFDSNLQNVAGLTVEQILTNEYNFSHLPLSAGERMPTPISTTIAGQLVFTVLQKDPTATYKVRFLKTAQTTANQDDYLIIPSSPLVVGTTYTMPFSITIPNNAGDKLFFEWVYIMNNPSAVDIKIRFEPGSDITFTYNYRYNPTYVPFYRPQELFKELIGRMTGNEYAAETSPYFGALKHWNKVFTSGDAIRGTADAKLKISWSQFFDFWDTFDAVGIREKTRQVLFDRKAALTDSVNLIDLGEVSRPAVDFDKSFSFNELAVGYPDTKNESGMLNGKNEVNTTFNFSLGTTKTPRKYAKISPVKVSCYDIEDLRIEGTVNPTTDNKADNDPFAIHIVDTLTTGSGDIPDHYELDRVYNGFVTGVDQIATVFNLIFSPKNCVNRSADYIRSCFFKCDGKTFAFTGADRNPDMLYSNLPTAVVESADFVIGDLAAPFFLPVLISVETGGPADDLLDLLDDIPTRGFQFTFDGTTYKGIAVENSINPKTNKKQTYTLLSHPDNDLTKLINYAG